MLRVMRTLLFAGLVAASALASAQTVTLVGTFGGREVGAATFTIEAQPDHSYLQTFTLKIDLNGTKIENRSASRIAPTGQTLSEEDKETLNGTIRKDLSIIYSPVGASVVDRLAGKTKSYPIPAGANAKDLSALWFVTLKPKLGAKLVATTFSVDQMAWQKATTTYVSDQKVKVGGKLVKGHQMMHVSPGPTLLMVIDDHGLPLEFNLPGVTDMHFRRS